MSKVKQWAEDTAEKAVDTVLVKLTKGLINKEVAKTEIMKLDVNLGLVGIDEFNIHFVHTAIINYLNINNDVYFLARSCKKYKETPHNNGNDARENY